LTVTVLFGTPLGTQLVGFFHARSRSWSDETPAAITGDGRERSDITKPQITTGKNFVPLFLE
jgi:hypothetical protein